LKFEYYVINATFSNNLAIILKTPQQKQQIRKDASFVGGAFVAVLLVFCLLLVQAAGNNVEQPAAAMTGDIARVKRMDGADKKVG
jgi:hypothetical protein